MSRCRTARRDPELKAHVTRRVAMIYDDGPSDADDRPPHVRAASGLSAFKEYLAVIQDDANWLALIDAADRIHALPLPPGPSGARVFSKGRGNKHEKFDLEACITLPGEDGHELIGFGSGSHPGREWILRVHEGTSFGAVLTETAMHEGAGIEVTAEFLDATRFYENLRANKTFSGAGLNIEGAVAIDADRIMLFQRGNAPVGDGLDAVDATADVSWRALAAHLADPDNVPPPTLDDVTHYDLGTLDSVRLTFSDADRVGDGRILYSASAEDPETGRIAGSVLGIIEPDGSARWTELTDQDGGPFHGKIEGLSRDLRDPRKVHFVIDDDDESVPSEIFEAALSDGFFSA
ncbi:DUF6929 family protein [Rhodospirillaceae bacterium SYSU D60014]|uniref:DUF6929 family protein n=1 Tax=Virgifigura deserti TaxID=2268457 RepID=UPI0013C49497